MNEQIREFMARAGTDSSGKWMGVDNAEKFAELIVKECASITLDYKNDDHYQGWLDHQAEILRHFGFKDDE